MNPDISERIVSERIRANMEVALDRACRVLPARYDTHENRKRVAQSLIECVQAGRTNLGDLTAAARRAVLLLSAGAGERGNGTQGTGLG